MAAKAITLWPLANSSSSTHDIFSFLYLEVHCTCYLLLASKPSSFCSPLSRNAPSPPSPSPHLDNSFRIQPRCMFFSVLSFTLHLDLIPVPWSFFAMIHSSLSFYSLLEASWGLDFCFIHHYPLSLYDQPPVYSWYSVGIPAFAEWMNTQMR